MGIRLDKPVKLAKVLKSLEMGLRFFSSRRLLVLSLEDEKQTEDSISVYR
tara:strand:- start:228 stop:377 length:150 start_codon:yes stop_codon:yes gene_type:complete